MTSHFVRLTSSSIVLMFMLSLVKVSYWSKFHANITTSFGVTTIFVYKGLTRNLEIENT